MLTPKQEKFCQCIIKGMNQTDAYREAYNTKNAKDETLWSNASRLMNDSKVAARLEELKKGIEKELIYSALESFNKLKEIQELALGNQLKPDLTNALKAEELKGKLAGLYVEKKDITANIDTTPFTIEIVK
jgi:phage terminase small subunit